MTYRCVICGVVCDPSADVRACAHHGAGLTADLSATVQGVGGMQDGAD